MKNVKLADTKKIFKPVIDDFSIQGKDRSDFLEAAFFAYAHKNFFIDKIFWGRLAAVEKFVLKSNFQKILDFGAGSGVLAHCLAGNLSEIIMTDTEPAPFYEIKERIQFPDNALFINPEVLNEFKFNHYFDAIIALDVLEHVTDLTAITEIFSGLLKPGGEIVISGPTENILYKLGRHLAGSEFTGDYHRRNITDVKDFFEKKGRIKHLKTIYPILPLFEIFSVKLQ